MLSKEYNFNEFTGMLSSYRESNTLLINEKVRQSDEINKLLTLQIAEDQIREAEMFSELQDHDLSSDFKSGFTLGKEYFAAAVEKLLMDMLDEDEIILTLHSGSEPQITLFDDEIKKVQTIFN